MATSGAAGSDTPSSTRPAVPSTVSTPSSRLSSPSFSIRGTAEAARVASEAFSITGSAQPDVISLTGTGIHGSTETPNEEEAEKVGQLTASIGGRAPDAPQEPTTTIAARVQTGIHIIARDNHYYDPISKQFLTLHFGSEVLRENWQECTEDLVGSVCARIELLLSQKNAKEGLALTFKDVKAYQFNWKSGEVSVEFASGGSYTFNCGSALREAMRPHLRKPEQIDKLPKPADVETGLHAIDPPLEPLQDAFIHRLAFDRSVVRKLENIIQLTSVPSHTDYNSQKVKDYKALLHLFHGLRHGVRVSLKKEDREALGKLINSHLGFFSSFTKRKLNASGNPLLGEALRHFRDELSAYDRPPRVVNTTHMSVLLQEAADGGCVDLGAHLQQILGRQLSRPSSEERHITIDVDSKQRDLSSDTPALTGKPTLHLEPRMNVASGGALPTWARVSAVICHGSGEEGSKSNEASYVHFTCDDEGQWWSLARGQAQKVNWSDVQQAAAVNAVHVSLDIDPVMQATPSTTPSGLKPPSATSSRGASAIAAPIPMLVLDQGSCAIPEGFTTASWDSLIANHPAVEALSQLRAHQGQLLTEDEGPKNHREIWQRFYPALQPLLINQENPLYAGLETLSPTSRTTVRQYFASLGNNLTTHTSMPHNLPQAVSYNDLQEMANLSRKKIEVYTHQGTLIFDPQVGASIEADASPLRYAAPSLDPKDPKAACILTPVFDRDTVSDFESRRPARRPPRIDSFDSEASDASVASRRSAASAPASTTATDPRARRIGAESSHSPSSAPTDYGRIPEDSDSDDDFHPGSTTLARRASSASLSDVHVADGDYEMFDEAGRLHLHEGSPDAYTGVADDPDDISVESETRAAPTRRPERRYEAPSTAEEPRAAAPRADERRSPSIDRDGFDRLDDVDEFGDGSDDDDTDPDLHVK